jgi:hypothetical protein
MRFFTPQLYQRFNSLDDAEADRANDEWEGAIQAYQQHLGSLRDRMPSQVAKLADLDLHDARILSRAEEIQAGGPFFFHDFPIPLPISNWSAVALITVRHEGDLVSLIYCLWDRLRVRPAPDEWTFSKLKEHWLYDEVDAVSERRGPSSPGPFLHRILLSTGVELEIPFTTVIIHRFTLPDEASAGSTTQAPSEAPPAIDPSAPPRKIRRGEGDA